MNLGGLFAGVASKIPPLGGRAMKYGYSNARVRAMKGLLLRSGSLDELVRVGTVEGMVELLQRTGYKNDLTTASVRYRGSTLIETAASWNFSRTMKKLIRITPKGDRDAVAALLVRYELLNLKTMMHARRLKKSYEDIRPNLVEVSGMDEGDFRRIMKADDLSLPKEIRKTPAVRRIIETAEESEARDAIMKALSSADAFAKMESALDSYVYLMMDAALSRASGKEYPQMRWILKKEIDAKNVMIIERLKKHSTPRERIRASLIKGGTMAPQMAERMMDAKDIQAALQIARPLFPQLDLKDVKSLTDCEIALEKSIAAQKALAFHRATLSAGVMIGFLLLKEEEVNNLRKIAKGKEFGMSESEVRSTLVTV